MKPRASIPATLSIAPWPAASASITAANAGPSASSGVMSLNKMPGSGKSGTSRMWLLIRSSRDPPA